MNKNVTAKELIELFLDPQVGLGFSETKWSHIITVLRHEKLLARFGYLAESAGVLKGYPEVIQRHYLSAMALAERHQKQVFSEVQELKQICAAKAKTWLLLKGAAYTLTKSKAGLGRVYNDIDVLVDKADLAHTEQYMQLSGWLPQAQSSYDEAYYREWTHEIPPLVHGHRGTVVDLHHNIVPPISGRAPGMSALYEHIVLTEDGIPTLSKPALALHSAIHLFFNEECQYGFRDMTDIVLLFEEFNAEDWSTFVALATATQFTLEAELALHFAQRFFKVQLPQAVLEQIAPLQSTVQKFRFWVFTAGVLPKHPFLIQSFVETKLWCIMLRGHYLKMPLKTLCYHLIMKTYRGCVESIAGKHFFTPQDVATQRVQPHINGPIEKDY